MGKRRPYDPEPRFFSRETWQMIKIAGPIVVAIALVLVYFLGRAH